LEIKETQADQCFRNEQAEGAYEGRGAYSTVGDHDPPNRMILCSTSVLLPPHRVHRLSLLFGILMELSCQCFKLLLYVLTSPFHDITYNLCVCDFMYMCTVYTLLCFH